MTLNLLQIVNRVQNELGLPQSAAVIGNPDATTTQLLALANRCVDEMRRMALWTACQFECNIVVNPPIITTGNLTAPPTSVYTSPNNSANITAIPTGVASIINAAGNPSYWQIAAQSVPQAARVLSATTGTEDTVVMTMESTSDVIGATIVFAQDTYELPSDFDHYQNKGFWDRTNRWQLIGPDSPQQDQFQRSGIVAIGPRRHFRQLGPFGNRFRIWPAPVEITQPIQIVFEYVSLNSIVVGGDLSVLNPTFAQYFTQDTDTPLIDDNGLILAIKWNFWQIKGFGYAEAKNDWIDYIDRLIATDGAAPTLTLTRVPTSLLISSSNVSDGNWPGIANSGP